MQQNKNMELFVGFDIYNQNIKILTADKLHAESATEYLHFNERIFTPEFFEEARGLLADYFEKNPSNVNMKAYVVLPNEAVGTEIFNVPNMFQSKQIKAIDAEIANLYTGKQKDKKINRLRLMRKKQYSIFQLTYFDKNIIADIYKLLTEFKVFPQATTFCGNALVNSVLAYQAHMHGKSFVVADIRLDYTLISVCSKGKTLGVATFRHGTQLLKRDKVELEYMQTNHEAGEIAVINAKEMARAKALTIMDDPSVIPDGATIETYAVDGAAEGEYSGDKTAAAAETAEDGSTVTEPVEDITENSQDTENTQNAENTENTPTENGEQTENDPAENAGGEVQPRTEEHAEGEANDTEFFESEEDEAARIAAQLAQQKIKKPKTYRKMPKRYPKFMVRETPTTEEGFLYENFRIIMKWILSYTRQAQLTEYISSPEFVIVNMPSDLMWLLDKANEEQSENDIKFIPFSSVEALPPDISGNLDLVGALFVKQYNKHNNF